MITLGSAVIVGVAVLLAGSLPIAAEHRPLIWDTGAEAGFIAQVVAFVLLSAAAWWSCSQTARLAHAGGLEAA